MNFFLRMEGVNIDSFISDTEDLSTVRGGGLMLLKAVTDTLAELKKQFPSIAFEPVSTGASSGLFELKGKENPLDNEKAEMINLKTAEYLREKFPDATFVVNVEKRESGDNGFTAAKETVLAKNRWRQFQQPTVVLPEINTDENTGVCQFDRLRPAANPEQVKKKRVSVSVARRRKYGKEQKQKFYETELEKYKLAPTKKNKTEKLEFTEDLKQLAFDSSQGTLNGKMAVIYLDGNRFGTIQTACNSETELQKWDSCVKEYRADALKALLEYMGQDRDSKGKIRLETLLWGGDEVVWVVPAWHGWNVLTQFYTLSSNWSFNNSPLTHAGGMVLCHDNAPIHGIVNLAKRLADSVKEEITESSLPGNRFQYLVLESFDHLGCNLNEYRKKLYPRPTGDPAPIWSLNGEEMKAIADLMTQLKESFPRRQLVQAAHETLQTSLATHEKKETFFIRLKTLVSDEARETQKALTEKLEKSPDPLLWLHLVDLWDYVG